MPVGDAIFLPIRQLAERIRTRQLSVIEVVELFLERLATLGPALNAVVTVTYERARRQARAAEAEIAAGRYRGLLHGIPYGAKDLLATAEGIPTTWGAAPFREQCFDYDATVIQRLDQAGAVLVGKLAMVELAGGMGYHQANASFTGPGINPWNRQAWSGGSSSGSGSAVSAGLVPFALGSETWGSILSPAANCGITGLRPTYGRVSRHGAMTLSWTLDKLGPLALTADDCGIVLEAIAGADPADMSTAHRPYRYDPPALPGPPYRLGVLRDATRGAQEEVRQNFQRSLDALRPFTSCEEISLPDFPYEAVTQTILDAEAASALEEFVEQGGPAQLTAPECRHGGYARSMVLARDYLRALRIRRVMAAALDALLGRFDALAAPALARVACPLAVDFPTYMGERRRDPISAAGNAAGLPAIFVPNGFGERGLPTGIQLVAGAYRENTLLAIARTYQQVTAWHERHPADFLLGSTAEGGAGT
jgi:aspartyl-tRNA(Asn)/glutamyl-tRNA(Gln) amidotransferase subunit A